MAPISHGNMFPSATPGPEKQTTLKVVSLESDAGFHSQLAIKIDVMHNYLEDRGLDNPRTILHVASSASHGSFNTRDSVVIGTFDLIDEASVETYIKENDVDIVYDPSLIFSKAARHKLREDFAFVSTYAALAEQIESFLIGWDVPWAFDDPVWNIDWLYKYVRDQTLARDLFTFMGDSQTKQHYNQAQVQYVRDVTIKLMHAEHAKQTLNYYQILRRHAYRRNPDSNACAFELVHHLSNYQIMICGGLDTLARLINSVYDLGFDKYANYGLEKTRFIDALTPKRKSLAKIYTLKKYVEWMEWMKERRNNLAHETNISLTPLLQRRRDAMTDAELDARVEASFDWSQMSVYMSQQGIDGMKAVVRQNIDIQENYESIVTGMMTLTKRDRVTREERQLIVFPLRAIQSDHEFFTQIIDRSFKNLRVARPYRSV